MSDPISDLVIRIKNASLVNANLVPMPFSNFKLGILAVLKKYKYIDAVNIKTVKNKKILEVVISKKIMHFKRLSKPGQRLYVKSNEIPRPLRSLGLVIISTPQGVISGHEARKLHVGGELICEIW